MKLHEAVNWQKRQILIDTKIYSINKKGKTANDHN